MAIGHVTRGEHVNDRLQASVVLDGVQDASLTLTVAASSPRALLQAYYDVRAAQGREVVVNARDGAQRERLRSSI